jgi:hypothetical protein
MERPPLVWIAARDVLSVPPIMPPQDGYLFLDRATFRESFAADVSPESASLQGPHGTCESAMNEGTSSRLMTR